MNGQVEKLSSINTERRPLQGVLNILDFNRHFYYIGVGSIFLVLIVSWVFSFPTNLAAVVGLLIIIGMLIPLLASAWVYDLANYYQMKWLKRLFPNLNTGTVANIHAGFDETSELIQKRFPEITLHALDFYDKENHTEPAIVRARKKTSKFAQTKQINTFDFGESSTKYNHIFVLSALHEIRDRNERILFLKACKSNLENKGNMVIVEHLRDLPNFLAFHIGFTHFFSDAEWKHCFKEAGLTILKEKKHTPLLHIYILSND